MTTHARLSPSAWKQWGYCPGSIQYVESLNIEDKPSKYAAEGTVAHEVHEQCLLNNKDAKDYLGETIKADGFSFKVNDNMVEAVQTSLDYIRTRIQEAEDFGYEVEMMVEIRSSLKYLKIKGLDGGTADVVLIFRLDGVITEVEIIDYKHGQGVAVEVKDNGQALCYVTGVIALPAFNGCAIHEGVKITISQPRAIHQDGPMRSWDIDKDTVLKWEEEELIPRAEATLEPDAPLVPTDDGCRFCNANGQCSALYAKTQEIMIADFANDALLPVPESMTVEQKKAVMNHAAMLRAFIVAVEAQLQYEVDSGSTEYKDAYKLVRKTTQRKLTDNALDEIDSPLLDYMTESDMYDRKPKGIGALEKAVKETMKENGVKGFVKEAKKVMSEITTKPEGGIVIALISDRRQGVQPSVCSDFDNLD